MKDNIDKLISNKEIAQKMMNLMVQIYTQQEPVKTWIMNDWHVDEDSS